MINGLFETHVDVKNLEQSVEFYKQLPGLTPCHYDEQRRIAFFWVGAPRKFMLGLWEKQAEQLVPRHFAFQCESEWILKESVAFLHSKQIQSYNFLKDGTERPMIFAWMPAVAIYFDDPDGNILEFICIIDGEAKPQLGVLAYEDWIDLQGKSSSARV